MKSTGKKPLSYKTFQLLLPAWNQEVEPLMEIPEFDFWFTLLINPSILSPLFHVPESEPTGF